MLRSALLLAAIVGRAFGQDAPTAEALLQRAIDAGKAQAARGVKYTFREDEDRFPAGKNGKPLAEEHRTFDNIMLEGDNYRKLLLVDGKPPDPKLQKKIDAELERARAERRTHPQIHRHEVRLSGPEQIARMYDARVTGEEIVSGRKTWRIDAMPKPGYRPANEEERRALALHRTVWIDQEEGVAIKFLNVFLRDEQGFQTGSEIETSLAKHDDDWLADTLVLRYKLSSM